jgi:hypothetical protein
MCHTSTLTGAEIDSSKREIETSSDCLILHDNESMGYRRLECFEEQNIFTVFPRHCLRLRSPYPGRFPIEQSQIEKQEKHSRVVESHLPASDTQQEAKDIRLLLLLKLLDVF